jgi:hypothetical protein
VRLAEDLATVDVFSDGASMPECPWECRTSRSTTKPSCIPVRTTSRTQPQSPGSADRVWYGAISKSSARWAGERGAIPP